MLLIHLQVYNIFHVFWLFSSFYPLCVSGAITYITSFLSQRVTVLICSLLVLNSSFNIFEVIYSLYLYYAKNKIREKKNCKQDTLVISTPAISAVLFDSVWRSFHINQSIAKTSITTKPSKSPITAHCASVLVLLLPLSEKIQKHIISVTTSLRYHRVRE